VIGIDNRSDIEARGVDIFAKGGMTGYGLKSGYYNVTILENLSVTVFGSKTAYGLHFISLPSVGVTNSDIYADAEESNYAIFNQGSSPRITEVRTTTGLSGFHNATLGYGYYATAGGPSFIRNSTIEGNTSAIFTDSPTPTKAFGSSIIGGTEGTGILICLNSDNGVDKELDSSCNEILP
jgi:hypothetical protein